MYRIAIVEDQERDASRLTELLLSWASAKGLRFEITRFPSATAFLDGYRHQFEMVFMDIRMPGIDGMQAAHDLRSLDQTVVLVFLTSLAQYAIESYEVEATDYILKPITAPALELKLPRILSRCSVSTGEIVITTGSDTTRLRPNDLYYVEIFEHHLQFITAKGSLRSYGTLKEVEEMLPDGFFRINNHTIINLRLVTRVVGNDAYIGEQAFPLSRGRKKEFMSALHLVGMNG